MQAIILAAGMGKRFKEITRDITKCMVKINGITIIERMLAQLDRLSLERIILVVGYKSDILKNHISGLKVKTTIEYVENDIYDKTNNIYSLYLAKNYLIETDTLLFESDLIFEDKLLEQLINHPYPSLALVAKYESWMNGTVITLNEENDILSFLTKKDFQYKDIPYYYKTVNIYKFSKAFSKTHYVPFLEAYIKALGNNEYYEQVLKVITLLDRPEIKALPIEGLDWYEVDDIQDLDIAESVFANSQEEKLVKIEQRYGGYWRYPHMLDFCYLVNPFYPPLKLLDEIKANFDRLIVCYPSGQDINSLLVAKYFGLKKEQVAVGNGAAEIIKVLLENLSGKIGFIKPAFQEYPNRYSDSISFTPKSKDFRYSKQEVINFFNDKDISALVLINPDNPSGNYIKKSDVLDLICWAKQKEIKLILDESFIDFSNENGTVMNQENLTANPHLIIIRSISKSFGVPGLRLGFAASGDGSLASKMKKDAAIWNINSIAEFYLQIFEEYQYDYTAAIEKFKHCRHEFISNLEKIRCLRVLPTQANFVMCELAGNLSARELTKKLLSRHRILIKDLSSKDSINGEYIRIAIKTPEENMALINAITSLVS